jgi:DNA polymerase
MAPATDDLRAYVEYLRDMGMHDFYQQGEPLAEEARAAFLAAYAPQVSAASVTPARTAPQPSARPGATAAPSRAVASPRMTTPPSGLNLQASAAPIEAAPPRASFLEVPIPKPTSFDNLMPLPEVRIAPADKAAALVAIQNTIGDCTRCPLAYAGRRKIVFGDGDANARLMFVGEGPGADEDASGIPFVGKAGQLLNNMISAMGLKREQVYIANIVKCRPPANRTPEPVEANTCSPFLLEQIDVVQPEIIVALGGTAATYLLGVKQSLASLRGAWFSCRGAKVAVTYHPAYLLRDPSQKGEAWKDLQRVMAEMGLKPPTRPA